MSGALDALVLVGPYDVVETAQRLASLVQPDRRHSPDGAERARTAFLTSARIALDTFPATSRTDDVDTVI